MLDNGLYMCFFILYIILLSGVISYCSIVHISIDNKLRYWDKPKSYQINHTVNYSVIYHVYDVISTAFIINLVD